MSFGQRFTKCALFHASNDSSPSFAIILRLKTHRKALWRFQLRWYLQYCIQNKGALALSGAIVLVSQDHFCNVVNFAKYLGDSKILLMYFYSPLALLGQYKKYNRKIVVGEIAME
jgi:hypothetical protein